MAFQAEEMLQYLNYAAMGIIGLAAFWGFVQGFYKSTFFLIWTVGVLVLAYLMMPVVSAFLMTQDISMVEQYYQADVAITNLKETIPALLISMEPALANVLVDGSDALALVYGMTQMVLQLVFLIVVLVFNATVFKVVGWILWLIFKPKGKKKKKSGLSRLLGTGVGTLRGAFSILLMSIPIAGLVSFSGALDLAMTQQADAAPTYQLMLINDEMVLVEVQQPQAEQDEMIEEVQQFLSEYRSTYVGMIAGYVKIDDVALDEYVFDSIFEVTVKTDNVDTSIKFRAELEKALEAVNLLVEANDGSTTFDDTIIYKLSPEDVTAIMGLVSDLDLIEVIIPVGLEYLLNSGEFDEMLEGYEDLFVLEDLKAIDYMQDLGVLGDVFADALTLIQAQSDVPLSDINYFMFDGEVVTDIFANLGQLEMLQYGLPIGLNYALGMPDVEAMLLEQGVTKEDLTLPEGADLQGDFEAIADLYLAIQGLGFDSMDDFETLQDPEVFGAITDQAISDVFDALFAFNMVNDNTAVVSGLIYDQMIANLPADYQGLITEADINANFNATEITNLVLLAKVVVSTGILTLLEEENPDYTTVLSDANIDAIVAKISGSNLISTKMNDVIGSLLTQLNLGVTLVIPPTIDWGSESGQTELTALLKAAREILSADILGGDLSLLTNESIDALAGYLSDSYVIRYNLNAIFDMVSTQANLGDFEIVLPETVEEWTELEINSLLKAAKILSSAGSDPSALIALSEVDIHTIALSKVISNTFEAVFMDMVATGGDLEGLLSVPADLTWYSTTTEVGELEYLLLALKAVVPPNTDLATFSVDLNTIMTVDLDVILRSKTVEMTLVETIRPMIETGDLSTYIEPKLPGDVDYTWYMEVDENNTDGDLKPLLKAVQGLNNLGIDIQALDYQALSAALSSESAITDLNDLLLSSRILSNSLDKLFTTVLNDSAGLNITLNNTSEPTFWQGDGVADGELIKLLRAVSLVDATSFDANAFLTLSEADIHTVALSRVIALVFESVIIDMSSTGGDLDGQIFVPTGLTWYSSSTETGELENMLTALKVLVPGGDIATADFGFDAIIAADVDVLLSSKVIEHTAVLTVQPMIETGSLSTYIEPKLPGNVDYVWYIGIDQNHPDGDLKPLLAAVQGLDDLGLDIQALDYQAMTTALADEPSITNVNDLLLSSRILHNSLDKLFTTVLNGSAGVNVTLDHDAEPTFWQGDGVSDGQLKHLLRAISIVGASNFDANAFLSLSEAQIHTVALSRVIAQVFEAVLTDMAAPGGDLDGDIHVPTNLTWHSTSTENGELENLLLALKVLVPGGDIATADFGFDAIIAADIDLLLASKVIEHTAVLTVQPMIETGSLTNYIEPTLPGSVSYVWYQGTDLNHPDGDLKPLLKSIQTLDGIGISLTTFDYTAFSTVLAVEANIQVVNDAMLESRILHNSLDKMFTYILNDNAGVNIQLDNQANPTFWQGDGVADGELIKLLRGISKLGSGTMDANLVLGLSNADIHTIALSEVISLVFENVFTDMVSPTGTNPGLLVVPTGLTWHSTDSTNGELENLLVGLKLLVPGGNINVAVIDIDTVLSLDLDTLVLSKVIEATLIEEVKPIIETGTLSAFINPTLPNAEPYKWKVDEDPTYPQGDLLPLLKAIRDMDALGIDYNNFNYASMVTAINDDTKAETLSDILLSSRVFEFSLDKMFNQILITQGGLDISPIDSSNDPDFWRGDGVNEGELVLVLKAINAADYFQSTDLSTINGTNSADLKAALNKINNSAILRPILGEIMDSAALSSASSWKVTPQPTLTKAEWTTEIDVLVDLLVELNGGFSLSSIDITNMTDPEADELGVILKLVAQSRLLDIEVISSFMKSGIESAFATTLTTPLGEVVDTPYATKVAAWNTPTTGEVDRLVAVIKGLGDIQPVTSLNPVGDYQGDYTDADLLGGFFNTMKLSTVLGPIVPELVLVVTPDAYESNLGTMDSSTDYQVLLRQFSDDVWYAILNP